MISEEGKGLAIDACVQFAEEKAKADAEATVQKATEENPAAEAEIAAQKADSRHVVPKRRPFCSARI